MAWKIIYYTKSGYSFDSFVPYTDCRYYQNVMKYRCIVRQPELQLGRLMAQTEQIQEGETRPTHPPPLLHHPGTLYF